MSEAFIHRAIIEGSWPHRDEHFTFTAMLAETISVYYWCESFCDGRGQRKVFCVIGQRGLSEYAAQATNKVARHIYAEAEKLQESWGWKFGAACSLRDALRIRRDKECKLPEYMEQCTVSTYRAKKQLHHNYQVATKDAPVSFDIEGFHRGRKTVWTLKQFKTPIQVLDEYARQQKEGIL